LDHVWTTLRAAKAKTPTILEVGQPHGDEVPMRRVFCGIRHDAGQWTLGPCDDQRRRVGVGISERLFDGRSTGGWHGA
jgi:hypothetical protein